jgi:hypothetical protein
LQFANVNQDKGQWLINNNNPTIKRLDVQSVEVRKALIQELLLVDKK